MQHDALANVYATSLFELADEAGGEAKIEEVNDELEQIVELTRHLPDFGDFLASPIIDRNARREGIRTLFDGRITDITLRFLLTLNDRGRLNRLESIAEAHEHLVQERFGRIEVDVFTASLIGEQAQDVIAERIRDALGKEPVLHVYADPEMIGGVKLRIGDQLIDGSVQTQLRRMRENLLSTGTELRARMERVIEEDTSGGTGD